MVLVEGLRRLAQRYPALVALLAQLLATALLTAVVLAANHLAGWRFGWLTAGLLQGLMAATLGRWLGLSRWWWWLNLGFVPALLAFGGAPLPSWVFLAAFLLLLLFNWNSFTERVPLYLTGAQGTQLLAGIIAQQPAPLRFVDLGCGPAGPLLTLARQFPTGQFVGVETAPLSYLLAKFRALFQSNCSIRYQSLWRTDLAEFNVLYCFLSPAPMAALWQKSVQEMRPGALFVSNTFEVPGVAPEQTLQLNDWRDSSLLLWRIPG
ncbi:class I SAM-dependent methyltransferase [Pseudomonas sp. EL_65y_Pfl2_R95]|uniref:class I SAM-dependent methyltransferase n=1 Tax=Pseudomonas sp. EL_65y_Pfl2_R95 TaxID=3088698 RepID=UPI0030DA043A